jgi:hypothetical protein
MRLLVFILYIIFPVANIYAQVISPTISMKNGKFGLIDEHGNVLIESECDTIYSTSGNYKNEGEIVSNVIRPFFVLKKSSKYAYAYFSSKDYVIQKNDEDNKWQWVVSDFIYDDLQPYEFESGIDLFTMKYRIGDKWGIMYSRYIENINARLNSSQYVLYWLPLKFSKLQTTEAIYDYIGKRYGDGLLDVVKTGKYSLVYLSPPNVHLDYGEDFDTIPLLIYTSINNYVHFSRFVRKNGNWGIVKLDVEKKELDYVVPCHCDTVWDGRFRFPKSEITSRIVFLCEKRSNQKIVIYDKKDSLSVNFNYKVPIYHYGGGVLIDTIPNESTETHKKYALIHLGIYYESTGLLNKGYCLVDMQSGETTFYIDDDSTAYEIFFGYHGIIIEKQIKTETSTIFEYVDFITGEQKMVLESKKDISYITQTPIYHESKDDYLLIMMMKEKKGEKKFTYKYYYDFRKKKFFKGKCKGCQ